MHQGMMGSRDSGGAAAGELDMFESDSPFGLDLHETVKFV